MQSTDMRKQCSEVPSTDQSSRTLTGGAILAVAHVRAIQATDAGQPPAVTWSHNLTSAHKRSCRHNTRQSKRGFPSTDHC
eukprot:6379343-Amphidinium_carterae.1